MAGTSIRVDWEQIANDVVAGLRAVAGRDPYDRALSDLVGALSTRSETFCTRWAAHDVRKHHTGSKRVHHPLVGELTVTYEAMELSADAGLTMFVYAAEPARRPGRHSPSSQAARRQPTGRSSRA